MLLFSLQLSKDFSASPETVETNPKLVLTSIHLFDTEAVTNGNLKANVAPFFFNLHCFRVAVKKQTKKTQTN